MALPPPPRRRSNLYYTYKLPKGPGPEAYPSPIKSREEVNYALDVTYPDLFSSYKPISKAQLGVLMKLYAFLMDDDYKKFGEQKALSYATLKTQPVALENLAKQGLVELEGEALAFAKITVFGFWIYQYEFYSIFTLENFTNNPPYEVPYE